MVSPKGLTKELADALEISQNNYQGKIGVADRRILELSAEERRRMRTAQTLKAITVTLGIVLVPGFLADWQVQAIGVVILLIVGLERVYANRDRLVSITSARDAYVRVRRQTQDMHEHDLVPIIRIRESKAAEAANKLMELNQRLTDTLAATTDKIEDALAKDNYQLLGRLTLDEQKDK